MINAVKHGNREDRSKHVTVEFTLAPTPKGTRVRMVQTGFPGLRGWFVLKGAQLGWKQMLHSALPAVLAR